MARCLTQNADEESGDIGPDFSTPELAILKQTSPGHLNLILFFSRDFLWPCLTERKKR